jgi:hypothetical protein
VLGPPLCCPENKTIHYHKLYVMVREYEYVAS